MIINKFNSQVESRSREVGQRESVLFSKVLPLI
jgi:hypothetical protein